MATDPVEELFHLSSKRCDVLPFICDGTLDKQLIEEQTDSSRPTIDRAFRELEEAGVISSTGTTYEVTTFGRLYCQEFYRTSDVFETLSQAADVLSKLPSETTIDMRLLKGADIYRSKEHAPQEPFMQVANLVLEADRLRGYTSTLQPHYVDLYHTAVVDEGMSATAVLTEEVIETARANYREQFGEASTQPGVSVHVTPCVEQYALIQTDTAVVVPIEDQHDHLTAVIVNDTDAAIEWAEEQFERFIEHEDAYELSEYI